MYKNIKNINCIKIYVVNIFFFKIIKNKFKLNKSLIKTLITNIY